MPELELALNTGLRLSEQYGLTWVCVDYNTRNLTIPLSKNRELRHIPLNDEALSAVATAHDFLNGQPYVFLNSTGHPFGVVVRI
jgi:integrase